MSGSIKNAYLPQPLSPVVDPGTGLITQTWWFYFQRLYARTGAGTGGDFGSPAIVDVAASPFSYTAPSNGAVLISGGGVKRARITPDGSSYYAIGQFYGAVPLASGWELIVEYVRAPVITFLPGA